MEVRPKCENGCGFYGDPANRNLCSKCYTDFLKKIALETKTKTKTKTKPCNNNNNNNTNEPTMIISSAANTVDANIKTVNRCGECKKQVGLTGFGCGCGGTYCGLHRYPEKHACSFNRKKVELEREALTENLYAAQCKANKLQYSI